MFATGPYTRPVPFVNIQGITVSNNVDGESLNIALTISNEVKKTPALIKYSNYCVIMSDRKKFDQLTSSPALLIKHLAGDRKNARSFVLGKDDFKLKAPLNAAAGTNIFNHTYSINRIVPRTKDLYVAVFSFMESQERLLFGNIAKDIILKGDQTPTVSYVYRLQETVAGYGKEGSIWPGAVHRHEGVFMAGNTHSENPHPTLGQQVVASSKTQDMRVLREAQGFSVVPSPLTASPYLSPITLSRNLSGNIHGLFSLSHIDFARENTNFGLLIKNPTALMSAAPLEDIIVYQKVVKGDTAGNSLTPGRPSRCAITEVSTFKQVASLNNGVTLINGFNNNQILNFAFIDTTAQEYQSNMLEYKIEIVLKDETLAAMRGVTSALSQALKALESARDPQSLSPGIALVDAYISAVGYLLGTSAFHSRSAASYRQNLLAIMNTGPESRGQVVQLVQDFSIGVTAATQPTQNITYGGADYKSFIYRSKKDNTIRLTHIFQDKLNILHRKGIGLDYVDGSIEGPQGALPLISFAGMNTRVAEEVQKYSINNPNAGGINQYGYLTPRSVRLRANPIVVPSTTLANNTKNFVSIIRSTIETNPAVSLETAKDTSTNMVEILNQAGIGVTTNDISIVEIANASETKKLETTDSTNYLPSGSAFATVDTPQDFIVSGSSEGIALSRVIPQRLEESALINTMVNQTVTNFSLVTGIANAANIAGSLALQKATEDASSLLDADSMTNMVNYGSIVQVQYLTNYSQQSGIRQQNWSLLTPEVYERISSLSTTPLLCRLVLMSETLDAPNLVDLQPLASLFVLGVPPRAPRARTFLENFQDTVNNINETSIPPLTSADSSDTLYAANIPMARSSTGAASRQTTRAPRGGY
jgi:hypothetical protein